MEERNEDSPDNKLTVDESDNDLVCGACLMELFVPEHDFICSPAGCPHLFHSQCLKTWAELQNTCPQCKLRFHVAGMYKTRDKSFVECVKFKKRDRVGRAAEAETVELPVEVCEKCHCPGNDDDMILCDGMDYTCNALFHFECVGFDCVPSGLWFCESCIEKGYIPEELKRPEEPLPKPKKQKSSDQIRKVETPSSSLLTMPPPQMFPRKLVVQLGATRTCTSSGLPRPLMQPLELPVARPPTSSMSVFARFRQRRLEMKSGQAGV